MDALKKFSESFLITSAICAGIAIPIYYTRKWYLNYKNDNDFNTDYKSNSVYYLNKRINQLEIEILNETNYDNKTKLIELKDTLSQRIINIKQKEDDDIRKIK
jgi:hypothetical protein